MSSGQRYLERLNDGRLVWLNGEVIRDLPNHPDFRGSVGTVRQLLDLQDDPETENQLVYEENGKKVHLSFLVPRSKEDLKRKSKAYKIWSDRTFGVMSRLSEYARSILTGWYAARSELGGNDGQFAEKIARYYRHSLESDLLSTVVGHDPQIDRTKKASEFADPYTMVRIVRENQEGIIVRGAKMIATAAPYVDELLVFPHHKRPQEDARYATMFAVPVNTPGLHVVCRESFASQFKEDHPLSSRFDEMDAVIIFDEVLIPWERVFIKDDPEAIWKARNHPIPSILSQHQTVVRLISKLEFVAAIGNEIAETIGATRFLHVQEKLAELFIQLETIKALLVAAEEQVTEVLGVTLPALDPLVTARNLGTRFYPRAIEILQQIGAGGFLQLPSRVAELNGPIGDLLQSYYRGANGNAAERTRLFKTAWDLIGTPLASRHELYERFYSGDPVRTFAAQYLNYDKKPLLEKISAFTK